MRRHVPDDKVVMTPAWQGCMASGLCKRPVGGLLLTEAGSAIQACRPHLQGLLNRGRAELIEDNGLFLVRDA